MSSVTTLALIKRKAAALVTKDEFRAAVGDEGTSAPYNVVTLEDVDMMQGQFWSGPPLDPDNPDQGPDPTNVNSAVGSVLMRAVQDALNSRCTIVNAGSQSVSGATTLSGTVGRIDADLFSSAGDTVTLDADPSAVGDYEITASVLADSAGVDSVVEVWLEAGVGSPSEVDGTRRAIPLAGSLGTDRGSAGFSVTVLDAAVSTVFRVRAQVTLGTASVESFSFEVRRAG